MSETIILYDAKGNIWVTHSPSTAEQEIASGRLFRVRPTHEQIIAALTPDDTQEAAAVRKSSR